MSYDNLREANRARQIEWDKKGDMTLSYSGNELAGEVGELIEQVSDFYYFGAKEGSPEALRDEFGDVMICCDLLAARFDLELNTAPKLPKDDDATYDLPMMAMDMAVELGRVCNIVKKLERESFGMVGSISTADELRSALDDLLMALFWMARRFKIDPGKCAAEKFNKTSQKYGLQTRMVV